MSIGSYGSYLVPIALLIELYPMVSFSSVVPQRGSVPPFPMYVLTTPTLHFAAKIGHGLSLSTGATRQRIPGGGNERGRNTLGTRAGERGYELKGGS